MAEGLDVEAEGEALLRTGEVDESGRKTQSSMAYGWLSGAACRVRRWSSCSCWWNEVKMERSRQRMSM